MGEAKRWDGLIESPGCSNVLGEHRAVSKIEGGEGELGTEAGPNSSTRWQWKGMGPREAFGAVGDAGQGGFGARVGHRIPGGSGAGAAVINGEGERRSVGESIVRSQVE